MAEFVDAVLIEAEMAAQQHDLSLQTVYLGGGTPTALSEQHLARMLSGLAERLDFSQVREFTCEVNPRTVTDSKSAMMRSHGIDRISLGIQAWDEATLKTLGRDHAPDDAEETYRTLRAADFRSINIDLMFSIPGQTLETWSETLERSISLEPDHLSAYNLNYEEDTEFFERLRSRKYRVEEERDAEFFLKALDWLSQAGYEHYEISNYARRGHRSSHNEAYWLGADYLGLGPSAYSTAKGRRWQNVPDTSQYLNLLHAGRSAGDEGEWLTADQKRTERFGLELRTAHGLPLALIHESELRMLNILAEEGLLVVQDSHIRLTRAGKPLVDSVAVALMGGA
jgi:oxygen-independent coproporphyrinogen III oxidase